MPPNSSPDPHQERVRPALEEILTPVRNAEKFFSCGCGIIFFSIPVIVLVGMFTGAGGFFEALGIAMLIFLGVGMAFTFICMEAEKMCARSAGARFNEKFPVSHPDREPALQILKSLRKEGTGIKELLTQLGVAEELKDGPTAPAEDQLARGLNPEESGSPAVSAPLPAPVPKEKNRRKTRESPPISGSPASPVASGGRSPAEKSGSSAPASSARPPFIPLEPFAEDSPQEKTARDMPRPESPERE